MTPPDPQKTHAPRVRPRDVVDVVWLLAQQAASVRDQALAALRAGRGDEAARLLAEGRGYYRSARTVAHSLGVAPPHLQAYEDGDGGGR